MQNVQETEQGVFEGHDICEQTQSENITQAPAYHVPVQQKSMTLSYLSAIIYPIIYLVVLMLLYFDGVITLLGMISGIAFSAAMGVTIVMGGFYFILIPLPYIFVYKGGCCKNQSTKRRVLLLLLTLALLALALVFPFAVFN